MKPRKTVRYVVEWWSFLDRKWCPHPESHPTKRGAADEMKEEVGYYPETRHRIVRVTTTETREVVK